MPLLLPLVIVFLIFATSWSSLQGSEPSALAPPSFQEDVVPLFTRFGCSAGSCHGKLAGQNGFRLSLRGYAPELDYESIVLEARGRRVSVAAPEASLLIRKAKGAVPHGGGSQIQPGTQAEQTLLAWVKAGAPGPLANEPRLRRITISPAAKTLTVGQTQTISVIATYSDNSERDVTWLTQFASSDAGVLGVSAEGVAIALRTGEAVVRATFQGQVEIATFTMPVEASLDAKLFAVRNNVVDDKVFEKLATLGIAPSPLCDDATFIRRAYLDAIGTLPTAEEIRSFLAEPPSDNNGQLKRSSLVERLLGRPEFADFWALQLGDLLQNRKERDHDVRGTKGVRAFHHWLREQLLSETSWRDIASAVLTAAGSCEDNPAVGFYIVTVGEKESAQSEVADSVAQAFLGTRIGCARCHNHPLEKYTQDDYYHFVGFFTRVSMDRKSSTEGTTELFVGNQHMLNLRRELNNKRLELELLHRKNDEANKIVDVEKRIADLHKQIDDTRLSPVVVSQPRTGKGLSPQPLDRSVTSIPAGEDPRKTLTRWIIDPSNEHFSGAMVNRLWKHFFDVGLVEPVDDLRATNPPSNRALWDTLNHEFVGSGYSLKHIMRLIMNSRAYQLSAQTSPDNQRDTRFYSHYYARRLPAEVLLDAICQTTGMPERFSGYPLGMRAIQVPDSGVDSYFLSLFGRSERTTACACERKPEVTLPQLLHLQNSDALLIKLASPESRLTKLLATQANDQAVTDELFLSSVGRLPSDRQRQTIEEFLKVSKREELFIDTLWSLLNSKDFTFNH